MKKDSYPVTETSKWENVDSGKDVCKLILPLAKDEHQEKEGSPCLGTGLACLPPSSSEWKEREAREHNPRRIQSNLSTYNY